MSSIEIGVTHQIRIGREDAWVKLSYAKDFDESRQHVADVIEEVERTVNKKITGVIERVVETVNEYERNNR